GGGRLLLAARGADVQGDAGAGAESLAQRRVEVRLRRLLERVVARRFDHPDDREASAEGGQTAADRAAPLEVAPRELAVDDRDRHRLGVVPGGEVAPFGE